MITGVPTANDFNNTGWTLLNIAWENLTSLLITLDIAAKDTSRESNLPPLNARINNFWESSNQILSSSLIIIQQGFELIIKGKICAISPYLLISNNPKDWPRRCDRQNTAFSEFYSLPAKDLIKIYNTFSITPFTDSMYQFFEELRKDRNIRMHSVDNTLRIDIKNLIVYILKIHNFLRSPERVIEIRKKYLEESNLQKIYGKHSFLGRLTYELILVSKLLNRAEMETFFDFPRSGRIYICLDCQMNLDHYREYCEAKTAALKPNEPSSTNLYCFICGDQKVERKDCSVEACPGNVISLDHSCCCTCGEFYDG